MRKTIPLRLDEDLLARVDELRGLTPRNLWLTKVIEQATGHETPQALIVPSPIEQFRPTGEKASHRCRRGPEPARTEKRGRGVVKVYTCTDCGKELT